MRRSLVLEKEDEEVKKIRALMWKKASVRQRIGQCVMCYLEAMSVANIHAALRL